MPTVEEFKNKKGFSGYYLGLQEKMKRGLLISLSGFDGAGKSTQVRLILDSLKMKGLKVRATEAMFSYFALKPFISSLRTATGSPPAATCR